MNGWTFSRSRGTFTNPAFEHECRLYAAKARFSNLAGAFVRVPPLSFGQIIISTPLSALQTDESNGRSVVADLGSSLAGNVPEDKWDEWEVHAVAQVIAAPAFFSLTWIHAGLARSEFVFVPPPSWNNYWWPHMFVAASGATGPLGAVGPQGCPTGSPGPVGPSGWPGGAMTPCSGCGWIPCQCPSTVKGLLTALEGKILMVVAAPKTREGADLLLEEILTLPDGFLEYLYKILYEGRNLRIDSAKRAAEQYLKGLSTS